MKIKILVTLLAVMVLAACKKDKYQTKPQLTFKKVNTNFLQQNQDLVLTVEVTDAEGDIQDSIWIQKVEPKCSRSNFTDKQQMPQFTGTKNFKGDIQVTYNARNIAPQCIGRNDTAFFRFWIKDKAKNTSDTAVSSTIIILR